MRMRAIFYWIIIGGLFATTTYSIALGLLSAHLIEPEVDEGFREFPNALVFVPAGMLGNGLFLAIAAGAMRALRGRRSGGPF